MYHCDSSLDPNTEIYLDAKAVLGKEKATSEDAYLQETRHF